MDPYKIPVFAEIQTVVHLDLVNMNFSIPHLNIVASAPSSISFLPCRKFPLRESLRYTFADELLLYLITCSPAGWGLPIGNYVFVVFMPSND